MLENCTRIEQAFDNMCTKFVRNLYGVICLSSIKVALRLHTTTNLLAGSCEYPFGYSQDPASTQKGNRRKSAIVELITHVYFVYQRLVSRLS